MQKRVVEPQADEARTEGEVARAEPSRGAPQALTAAEFWPGWADRNPIENWDEEVTEASVAIEFAEDYAEKLRAGHVVLLEALRRIKRINGMAPAQEIDAICEAAIKQAERT